MYRRNVLIAFVLAGLVFSLFLFEFHYAYIPNENEVINTTRSNYQNEVAYDVQGLFISPMEAKELSKTKSGKEFLSPSNGAIRIDEEFIELGREVFYQETFGNEVFMTDILGFLDGAITLPNLTRAILALRGEHTTNLRVALAKDVTIGDKSWKKGEKIDTGLDVPKGSLVPLGVPVTISEGRVRVGVSCAACHATVDEESGKVIEGAPNTNFDSGLLMAFASNTSAFFATANIDSLKDYIMDLDRTVVNSKGEREALPDRDALEQAVDESFAKWPKGNFDTTPDLTSNPTQTPDVYTYHDNPYSWSGSAIVGPFRGLSTFNNKVHSINSDPLSISEQAKDLMDIDKEVYIGTVLQGAASRKFRYAPEKGEKPSEFFANVDNKTPDVPGINESVKPPHFPKMSVVTPNGTIVTTNGHLVGEENFAMAAYQNSLLPPPPKEPLKEEAISLGKEVFVQAGCIRCHAGRAYTNNRIISVEEIQTEPSRAKAFEGMDKVLGTPIMWAPDTPTPIPKDATILRVPTEHLEEGQLDLAYVLNGTKGGYKVKGLLGLAVSAPYLHDGGVAVGENEEIDIGIPGTLMKGKIPDAYNSLKALVDKDLREKVVEANRQVQDLQDVHVDGSGHPYWVDTSAGFTLDQQQALIEYLLSITDFSGEEE